MFDEEDLDCDHWIIPHVPVFANFNNDSEVKYIIYDIAFTSNFFVWCSTSHHT